MSEEGVEATVFVFFFGCGRQDLRWRGPDLLHQRQRIERLLSVRADQVGQLAI